MGANLEMIPEMGPDPPLEDAGHRGPAVHESARYPGLAGADDRLLATAEARLDAYVAARGSVRVLILDCLKLVTLPGGTLASLPCLESLYCDRNMLTELPPELGQCAHLEEFSCSDNSIRQIPAVLGQCARLRALGVQCNKIGKLPPELGQCVLLVKIDACRNAIETIPYELGQCGELASLCVADNPLRPGTPQTPEELRAAWASRPHTKTAGRGH